LCKADVVPVAEEPPSRVAARRRAAAGPARIRLLAIAVAIGLAASACGGGSPPKPAAGAFVTCLSTQLQVSSGYITALAVEGTSCPLAESVVAQVLGDLNAGAPANGAPLEASGWRCFDLASSDQVTCMQGGATLYAQYIRQ
jgi:hypothetical protein